MKKELNFKNFIKKYEEGRYKNCYRYTNFNELISIIAPILKPYQLVQITRSSSSKYNYYYGLRRIATHHIFERRTVNKLRGYTATINMDGNYWDSALTIHIPLKGSYIFVYTRFLGSLYCIDMENKKFFVAYDYDEAKFLSYQYSKILQDKPVLVDFDKLKMYEFKGGKVYDPQENNTH